VGWDYVFETRVYATGPIVDGVLTGDLIVVGSGDPTPDGRAGDSLRVWVDGLKATGLTARRRADHRRRRRHRRAAARRRVVVGGSRLHLRRALRRAQRHRESHDADDRAGTREGQPATLSVEDFAQERPLVNRTVTTASTETFVWPEQRIGEEPLSIGGSVRPGTPPFKLTISTGNPTQWFVTQLRDRMIRGGIAVTGRAADLDDVQPPPDRTAATLHLHAPVAAALDHRPAMLKDSINLYGEALMRLNAASGRRPPTTRRSKGCASGSRHGASQRRRAPGRRVGLSRRDLIAPRRCSCC
jgi:D-alanyl-D-alanine carboxypeptidase